MSEKLTRTQQKNLERLGGVNPADEPFSRRQFVAQVGGYAAVAGGAVGAGLVAPRPLGHGRASSPRRRSRSRTTRSSCRRAGRTWSSSAPRPVDAEDYASKDEETAGPRGAGLQDGQGRAGRDGRREGVRTSSHEGRRRRHQAERRLRQEPRPRRDHPARHGRGRGQALPRRRCPQGDRRRQPDQQPRELLLQDQGRRRRPPRRRRADDAARTATSSSSTSAARRSPTPGGCSTARSARRPRSSASRR